MEDGEDFEELDAKLSTALDSLLQGELKRKVQVKETELSKKGLPITGRQITWMLYDFFKVSTNDGVLLDWEEILQVQLKGDNLSQFLTDWETTLLNIQEPPTDSMLEGLLRNQLEKSEQLKNSMSLYWQDITQRGEEKSHDKILTILRTHIDRKRLD